MNSAKKLCALLGVLLMLTPAGFGQSRYERGPRPVPVNGFVDKLTYKYKSEYVPPVDMSNSNRLDQLIRAGNLYLSLEDAIALALENNVGLESQRYQFQLTDQSYISAISQWDPVFAINQFSFNHGAQIPTNSTQNGGATVNSSDTFSRGFQVQQPFKTGGNATLGFSSSRATSNNVNSLYIPNLSGNLQMQYTQPLLQGFGVGLNTRQIVIARNNQRNADYAFRQQVNTLVNQVVQAYWNLVSNILNVAVAQQSLDLSKQLLDQNRKQVEIGTMAPIDIQQTIVQEQTAEQALVTAQAAVDTQEVSLKNLVSRNGTANASIKTTHIIPTSRIEVPEVEPVTPLQDLIDSAMKYRPELTQQQITMDNSRINLKAAKNSLLPQLNISASINNPAGGGVFNPVEYDYVHGTTGTRDPSIVNPDTIGGFSNILHQLFLIPTINYSFGFTFTVNLKNRAAQATYVTQELQLRQAELQLRQQENNIRADVENAQINIVAARKRYQVAEAAVSAQEQVVDATQRRFELGASTLFEVIQQQNTLSTQRQNRVGAQVNYEDAILAMDVATGLLLEKHNIVFDEAKDGQVARRPDPIPVNVNPPAGPQAAGAVKPPSPIQPR